jgi:hypothetical protein
MVEWLVRPALNPLRRSPSAISASLLEQTPRGATRAEVVAWADARGLPVGGTVFSLDEKGPVSRIIGEYSTYGLEVSVSAVWSFDKDGQLEAIEVFKSITNMP